MKTGLPEICPQKFLVVLFKATCLQQSTAKKIRYYCISAFCGAIFIRALDIAFQGCFKLGNPAILSAAVSFL